jgi:hypothetical protein
MLFTEIFWRSENKYCHFGHGLVGGTLINQILESAALSKTKDIRLNVLLLLILKSVA